MRCASAVAFAMEAMDPDEATAHLPLQIGDEMVNFSCDSTMGMFNPFHDVIDGHWSMLVTFPKDFDPVGTTELGHMAKLKEEFEARNVKVFALSCDTKMSHRRWVDETQELQECSIGFPMIVDEHGEISRLLGLVRPKVGAGKKEPARARPGCRASLLWATRPPPRSACAGGQRGALAHSRDPRDRDGHRPSDSDDDAVSGDDGSQFLRDLEGDRHPPTHHVRSLSRRETRGLLLIALRFSGAGSNRWRRPRTGCRARTSSLCRRCRRTPQRAFSRRCMRAPRPSSWVRYT